MNKFFFIFLIIFFIKLSILHTNAENTYINSNNIIFNKNENTVELAENSKINIGDINILIDRGIIDYNKNYIEVFGNFYIYEKQNILSGKNLKGDIKLNNYKANEVSYIYNNELKIDSSSVEKDDGNLYFYDSFITPCEIDGYFECPTWSIRVDKTKYNIEEDRFIHYDSFFQVADYKILYFPYFSHYGSNAPRKKGFLYPSVQFDLIDHGTTIFTPYYYPLKNNSDLTIRPNFTFNNNLELVNYEHQIDMEYLSGIGKNTLSIINELNDSDDYPFSSIKYKSNQTINKNIRYNLNISTNNSVSKARSNNKDSIPYENIYFQIENYNLIKEDDLFKFKINTVNAFDDINNGLIPIEIPSFSYNNYFSINKNTIVSNSLNLISIYRNESDVTHPNKSNKFILNSIVKNSNYNNLIDVQNNIELNLSYDETSFKNNQDDNYKKLSGELIFSNEALIKINSNSRGRIKLVLNSEISEFSSKVNETSNSTSFNYHNLFDNNRLYGSDLPDNSNRIVYGLENKLVLNQLQLNFLIGQSYDFKDNGNYLSKINQNENFSDVALESRVSNDFIKFSAKNRLDQKDLSNKETNLSINLPSIFNSKIDYYQTSETAFSDLSSDRELLQLSLEEKFGDNFKFIYSSNLDVKDNYNPFEQSIGFSFYDECSQLDIVYTNTKFNDNYNTKPTETIRFEFYMDYLGFVGYEQSTNLLNNTITQNYYGSQ